jgi:hypothetical protein
MWRTLGRRLGGTAMTVAPMSAWCASSALAPWRAVWSPQDASGPHGGHHQSIMLAVAGVRTPWGGGRPAVALATTPGIGVAREHAIGGPAQRKAYGGGDRHANRHQGWRRSAPAPPSMGERQQGHRRGRGSEHGERHEAPRETFRPNLPHAPVRHAPGLWPRFLGRSTHGGRGIPLPGALHAVTRATRALKGSR